MRIGTQLLSHCDCDKFAETLILILITMNGNEYEVLKSTLLLFRTISASYLEMRDIFCKLSPTSHKD